MPAHIFINYVHVPHQPISLFMMVLDRSCQDLSSDPPPGSIGIIFKKLLSRNVLGISEFKMADADSMAAVLLKASKKWQNGKMGKQLFFTYFSVCMQLLTLRLPMLSP